MATIKLKSTSGGSVSLDPVSSLASDISLTLPDSVGSAGQVLRNSVTPGTLEFGDIPAATPTAGQIIEQLEGVCDGRQVTVGSGTYTLPTATYGQRVSTTYVDLSGSNISYTPPSGTNTVVYDFLCQASFVATASPLFYFRLYVDGTEVTIARSTYYMYYDGKAHFRMALSVNNATEDIANAKIGSWTSAKTLKIQARVHTTDFQTDFHHTYYWEGTAATQNSAPTLRITAIA